MSTVVFDTSMSLDGYMTAAGRTADEPMGPGGQQLVAWTADADYLERNIDRLGAVIAGRVTYDTSLGQLPLELVTAVESKLAVHLHYRIVKDA